MEDRTVSADVDAAGKPQSTGKSKDRHIVCWSQQEDDLLREQVGIHGTENSWTCIAAQFKDKTSRQCRRRWYTYLNSECKKGGWSPEEDMILCEAQKIFGNRWTEISKVVSGRTDNAVKNRFNTLCKRRAKHGFSSNENDKALVKQGGKAVQVEGSDSDVVSEQPIKKARFGSLLKVKDEQCANENSHVHGRFVTDRSRIPLDTLSQNAKNIACILSSHLNNFSHPSANDELKNVCNETFLKGNDPRFTALMQQTDLLTSLAQKVNSDNSDQSLEDAWKELHNYLIQMGECGQAYSEQSEIDSLIGDVNESEELSSYVKGHLSTARKLDMSKIAEVSDQSVKAACPNDSPNMKENKDTKCLLSHEDSLSNACSIEACSALGLVQVCRSDEEVERDNASIVPLPNSELKENGGSVTSVSISEFNSPLNTVPPFRSFTEVIPSPNFTASERQFLLGVLALTSPSSRAPISNPSQQPSCKRALLHSL